MNDFTYFDAMIINAHTHKQDQSVDICCISFFHSDSLATKTPTKLVSCGIHPWHLADTDTNTALKLLKNYCTNKKIDAIGECGLDKFVEDFDKQGYIFCKQIEISENYQLPLIIHSVKMHHRILELRANSKAKQSWVLHGYNGSLQMAEQLVSKGIYLSFGEMLLKESIKLDETIKSIDKNYILFETDDADILVSDVYKKAQSLLNLSPDLLENQIYSNFIRVFGKR